MPSHYTAFSGICLLSIARLLQKLLQSDTELACRGAALKQVRVAAGQSGFGAPDRLVPLQTGACSSLFTPGRVGMGVVCSFSCCRRGAHVLKGQCFHVKNIPVCSLWSLARGAKRVLVKAFKCQNSSLRFNHCLLVSFVLAYCLLIY